MVVESIVSATEIEHKPYKAFFIAILLASIAIPVSIIFFPNYASMTMLFFVAMAMFPLLEKVFRKEEREEEQAKTYREMFKRNKPIIEIYFYFFTGLFIAYLVWFLILGDASQAIFRNQVVAVQYHAFSASSFSFSFAFISNVLVLTLFFLISIIYGVGAVLILAWNASSFAVAVASAFKQILVGGFASSGARMSVAYLLHQIPELFAFFMAANAGAILSISILKKRHKRVGLKNVAKDAFLLLLIGYSILILAAGIENTISRHLLLSTL